MNIKRIIILFFTIGFGTATYAQFNESGISAGFFDSSAEKDINFSEFHLPPMAVLFENAKTNPQIMTLEKARQLAEAEVAKQKKHLFSYVSGRASYSYGKNDVLQNTGNPNYQPIYMGNVQSYWNVGVSLSIPLEDILDYTSAVKRKKLEAEQAQYAKDIVFDEIKTKIASLYVKIQNDLVSLKTAAEAAAAYQGAGALNREEFHNGNMSIENYASTKMNEIGLVSRYQGLQTSSTTDILTLEIISHTPILTNSTTEITLEDSTQKTSKQLAKEKKSSDRRIKKAIAKDQRHQRTIKKAEEKAIRAAKKKK